MNPLITLLENLTNFVDENSKIVFIYSISIPNKFTVEYYSEPGENTDQLTKLISEYSNNYSTSEEIYSDYQEVWQSYVNTFHLREIPEELIEINNLPKTDRPLELNNYYDQIAIDLQTKFPNLNITRNRNEIEINF